MRSETLAANSQTAQPDRLTKTLPISRAEILNWYNPRPKDAVIAVDAEKVRYWLEKGALPTDTVRSLLKKAGVYGGAGRATKAPAA